MTAANLIQYAESYIASRDKEDARLPQEAEFFRETYDMAKVFLQLVTVLDEVIVAKAEEMTIHDESNMGDPVWRQRHKAELMADLKKYQDMRAKCG